MSTEAENPSVAAAAKDGKGKDRIGKVFYRVRTAFKRGDASRRKAPQAAGEPVISTDAPILVRPRR